ncbi:MAG: glycosyltransferase family 1 protein [Flavobacterium sp.]|nr:MAG: glycosyltransferase family 1 protein [Flavobacterium sp.]
MSKIKVLHVVHDFLFGGIEAFIFYLVQAQIANENLEIGILCCQDEDKVLNRRIMDLNVKIHYRKIGPFDLNLSTYLQIISIANEYNIVQLHIFKPLLAEAFRFSKAKVIYTNHSSGDDLRSNSISFKIKNRLLVRFLNGIAHTVTNNSNYTKSFWISMGVTNRNNVVIYNGVFFNSSYDSERAQNEYPLISEKFIVGTTSRFITWKRIEYLIDAYSAFEINKTDVVLLLVGDGTEKDRLVAYANSLGLKNVIFTGFKTNVIDYQTAMNVCVFASSSEPFGLVAVECLHLGKPTIVFEDGGGITEIVKEIEPKNIVMDVADLSRLLDEKYNEFLSRKIDSMVKARIQYSEKFNVKAIEKEFYETYIKVSS